MLMQQYLYMSVSSHQPVVKTFTVIIGFSYTIILTGTGFDPFASVVLLFTWKKDRFTLISHLSYAVIIVFGADSLHGTGVLLIFQGRL